MTRLTADYQRNLWPITQAIVKARYVPPGVIGTRLSPQTSAQAIRRRNQTRHDRMRQLQSSQPGYRKRLEQLAASHTIATRPRALNPPAGKRPTGARPDTPHRIKRKARP